MTDLGSTVTLAATNVNERGEPVDSGTAPSLTVKLPDGVTSLDLSSQIVRDSAGEWHASFVPTQSGRHVARWVGTGSDAFAYTEAFVVDQLDAGFLFDLAAAKRALGWTDPRPDSRDDEMRDYIAAVTPIIEDIVGPIVPRPCDEFHDGGRGTIVLLNTPVLSVTSVSESWGAGTTRVLTDQPVDVGPFGSYGYTIDKQTGTLQRRTTGVASVFAGGRRNVHVVYVAGQVPAPNVVRAAKAQFRFLWQSEQQAMHGVLNGDAEGVEYTESGFAVPRRVIELCGGSRRVPGIA